MKTLLSLPFVAKFINHELGGIIQNAAGAIVGALGAFLLHHFHLTLDADSQQKLDGALVAGGMVLATTVVQYFQTGSVKALQTSLGLVDPDGVIGPVTMRVASGIADSHDSSVDVARKILFSQHP